MSAEEKNEEKVLGKEAHEAEAAAPEISTPNVSESNHDQDREMAVNSVESGDAVSAAPKVEGVANFDGISLKEQEGKTESNKPKVKFPKLFIDREELTEIKVDIVFDSEDGSVYSVTQSGMVNTDKLEVLNFVTYTFKFRPICYDDMQKYRRAASFYAPQSGELVINRMMLRNLFLMNHLNETDMVDGEGNPVEITKDPETGIMDSETAEKLFRTLPALLDVVMTLFEKTLLILFDSAGQ